MSVKKFYCSCPWIEKLFSSFFAKDAKERLLHNNVFSSFVSTFRKKESKEGFWKRETLLEKNKSGTRFFWQILKYPTNKKFHLYCATLESFNQLISPQMLVGISDCLLSFISTFRKKNPKIFEQWDSLEENKLRNCVFWPILEYLQRQEI